MEQPLAMKRPQRETPPVEVGDYLDCQEQNTSTRFQVLGFAPGPAPDLHGRRLILRAVKDSDDLWYLVETTLLEARWRLA